MYAHLALHCWEKGNGGLNSRILPGEKLPTAEDITAAEQLLDEARAHAAAVLSEQERMAANDLVGYRAGLLQRYRAVSDFLATPAGEAAVKLWIKSGALKKEPPVSNKPAVLQDELSAATKRLQYLEARLAEYEAEGKPQAAAYKDAAERKRQEIASRANK